ncbi:RHS repeat-associated protein, partial [Flavobacterium chryseum]|uniref:RHS repeat-associated core domain-containing protein n=1 Tax=Flavobacterium sp. P3160 TaxID=2512113 RepID=UPI0010DC3444
VLEIIEENNYYPFGLKHKGYNDYVATNNKYKYNGKELQDELGLNMYDYGARNYDPALGRWMNIDPLAEKSRRFNPYTYALNNPVYFIDPDGMMAGTPPPPDWFVNSQTGEVIHNKNETKGYENKLGGNWEHLAKEKEIVDTNPKNNKEGNVKYSAEQSANLMEKNDRELAPKTVLSETTVRTTVSAITPGGAVTVQNTTTDEIWANVTYVPTGSQSKTESSTILQDETLSNGYSQVKISEKSYSAPSIVADVMNFLGNLLYPDGSNESKHYVNWKNYPKDGKLNEFKKAISN